MEVPPDGSAVLTRTRAPRTAPLTVGVVAVCLAVLALLGAGVHSGSGAQLLLDAVVSEALYAGDDRAALR